MLTCCYTCLHFAPLSDASASTSCAPTSNSCRRFWSSSCNRRTWVESGPLTRSAARVLDAVCCRPRGVACSSGRGNRSLRIFRSWSWSRWRRWSAVARGGLVLKCSPILCAIVLGTKSCGGECREVLSSKPCSRRSSSPLPSPRARFEVRDDASGQPLPPDLLPQRLVLDSKSMVLDSKFRDEAKPSIDKSAVAAVADRSASEARHGTVFGSSWAVNASGWVKRILEALWKAGRLSLSRRLHVSNASTSELPRPFQPTDRRRSIIGLIKGTCGGTVFVFILCGFNGSPCSHTRRRSRHVRGSGTRCLKHRMPGIQSQHSTYRAATEA